MKTLTDKQMIQAWSHMSTEKIRAMGIITGPGVDVERVNAGRRRILAIRESLATQKEEGA